MWVATFAAAAVVFLGGWVPGLAAAVLLGAYLWVQLTIVGPAARLLSVRRRLVSIWTVRLLGASAVALTIAVTELLTLLPFIGVVGKSLSTALQVATLAWGARRYLVWQTRREGRGAAVAWLEYATLVLAGLLLLVGASVMLYAGFWVTSQVGSIVAGVDALAAGAAPSIESLGLASTVGLGAATGTRAAVFLLVSSGVVVLTPEWAPAQLHFLGTPLGIGAALTLLVIESATERDDDLQSIVGLAAGGVRIGAAALLAITASGQPAGSTQALVAGVVGAGVALIVAASRQWLHGLLRELETEAFSPRRWLNRIEEGGVAGLAVAVYAGPMLATGIVVLGVLTALVAGLLARRADAHWRRPCPACARPIRVEASGCPRCKSAVPVARAAVDQAFDAANGTLQLALATGRAAADRAGRVLQGRP